MSKELPQRLRQMADHTGLDAVAELLREAAAALEHSSDHPEHHLEMVPAAQPLERAKQIWREDQERIAALQASIDRLHIENKALTIEGQSPTNIHGPFNACMYQDHCKAMEQQATARAMTDQEILDAADAIAAKRLAEQKAEREKLVNTTCQLCNSGRLKLDSNAYFEFLRCEQCNHVPLFIDGQDAAALARAGEKT